MSPSLPFFVNVLMQTISPAESYKPISLIYSPASSDSCLLYTSGFTFLKTQIYLTDTGKILRKPCRKAVVRQRRKLVRQYRKLLAGELSFEDIRCSYASWRGCMEKKQARRTIHSMNRLFDRLFIENWQREEVPLYG